MSFEPSLHIFAVCQLEPFQDLSLNEVAFQPHSLIHTRYNKNCDILSLLSDDILQQYLKRLKPKLFEVAT